MPSKAQLLWDFRGPHAKKTAEHHLFHLREYAASEAITEASFDLIIHSDLFVSAAMVVDMPRVNELRAGLKPHRGKQIQVS